MTGPAAIGWRRRGWKGPRVRCVLCNRRVRYGLVNIHNDDPLHSAFRVMCEGCVRLTMDKDAPPTWGTPEWKGEEP